MAAVWVWVWVAAAVYARVSVSHVEREGVVAGKWGRDAATGAGSERAANNLYRALGVLVNTGDVLTRQPYDTVVELPQMTMPQHEACSTQHA